MGERTLQDLQMKQALPLSVKILLTKDRIRQWANEFGTDGVYVSFSGGKDSTVLLHIVREQYPDVPAVFCDTGLEYPEIREFVKTFNNVTWLKPKMNFRKVIEKYGYPFIGKEVSERVYYAQKYLEWYKENKDSEKPSASPSTYGIASLTTEKGSEEFKRCIKTGVVPEAVLEEFAKSGEKGSYKIRELVAPTARGDGKSTQFDYRKWKWLAFSPYLFGSRCCDVMKKSIVNQYIKETGRKQITGQMASESRLRRLQWIKYGCNAFEAKKQVSNPMSFWTEQDVLLYIKQNHIPICSVYGDIVEDGELEGQMSLYEYDQNSISAPKLKTTGCNRTGCMFCGYGCHLDKPGEGRFERMKVTHPKQYEWIMKPWDEGGLGYKEVIDWLNENGNLHIRY